MFRCYLIIGSNNRSSLKKYLNVDDKTQCVYICFLHFLISIQQDKFNKEKQINDIQLNVFVRRITLIPCFKLHLTNKMNESIDFLISFLDGMNFLS